MATEFTPVKGSSLGVVTRATVEPNGHVVVYIPGTGFRRVLSTEYGASQSVTVTAHTTSFTITGSGHHSNAGASGAITGTLPAAVIGVSVDLYAIAAHNLIVAPVGSDLIGPGATGEALTMQTKGSHVTLTCFATGLWSIVTETGMNRLG